MYTKVLMVPPTHFFTKTGAINYEINRWMKKGTRVDLQKAIWEWIKLKEALIRCGVKLFLFPQAPGCPDMAFVANGVFVYANGRVVLSRFRHPERQEEEQHFEKIFQELGYQIDYIPEGESFEGSGDARIFYDEKGIRQLALGYGPRSTRVGVWHVMKLAESFFPDFYAFRLQEPWYHLDLCFCPIGAKALLYYPAAFRNSATKRFLENQSHAIPVSCNDANHFVCNGIPLPANEEETVWNFIVDDRISEPLERELTTRGIIVTKVRLREFNKAGGDAFCLVNFIG